MPHQNGHFGNQKFPIEGQLEDLAVLQPWPVESIFETNPPCFVVEKEGL